ncbi:MULTISPECIES: hypothetical protein [unclassified Vibrio]|uniref:hypothetical protein n=1 Tax=unclassified Vibrio TaxID=2614977 RepID=UPI0025546A4F|nr:MULTISPECIES: hypothetical protein [unclassified Vibrio]MDK9778564.1 hypothetical protein [Vibrio sp. D401a]MDK9803687.1 hypothetical protein [Vibrio sp. D406a]
MSVALDTQSLVVEYDPQSLESLRQALRHYREALLQENAFDNYHCHVRFQVNNGCDDQIGSLLENKIAQEVFAYVGYSYKSDIQPTQLLNSTYLTSEGAFFLRACQHQALESELEETAKLICHLARQFNDSSEMWVSEEQVFGLLPLLIVGLTFPRLAFYLGGYTIPYWDSEHAPHGEFALGVLTNHLGYTHDTLKAFCYCDNSAARGYMFDDSKHESASNLTTRSQITGLLKIFREKPHEFEVFRSLMKQRFADQDYLQYTDDSRYYVERPVDRFIYSIMSPIHGIDIDDHEVDYHAVMMSNFIDSSAEQAAVALTSEIEAYLGRPIVPPKVIENEDDYYRDHYYYRGTGIAQWKSFITEGFNEGKTIWHYIESGEDAQVLDVIEPCNIQIAARKGNFDISEKFEYYLGRYDSYHEEMMTIVGDILYDWHNEDLDDAAIAENNQKILRLFDVLHCWNNKASFHADVAHGLVHDFELISDEDFTQRYNGDWKAQFLNYVKECGAYRDNIRQKETQLAHELFNKHREEATDLLEQLADAFDEEFSLASQLAFCAGMLYHDKKHGINDRATEAFEDKLASSLKSELLLALSENSRFHCIETAEKRWRYVPLTEEEESQAKQDWKIVDAFLSNESDDFDVTLKSFKGNIEQLSDSRQINKNQPYYEFLRDFDDKAQKLLVAAHVWGSLQNTPEQIYCHRLLLLWLTSAPAKVTRMLSYFYCDRYGELSDQSHSFVDGLEYHSEIDKLTGRLELLLSQIDRRDDDEISLMDMYFDQFEAQQQTEQNKQLVRSALKKLRPDAELRFFELLEQRRPNIKTSYYDEAILDSIRYTVSEQMGRRNPNGYAITKEQYKTVEWITAQIAQTTLLNSEQLQKLLDTLKTNFISDFDTSYGIPGIDELYWKASPHIQDNLLRLFALNPSLGLKQLESERDLPLPDLFQQLYERDAQLIVLLKYAIKQHWVSAMPWFTKQTDLKRYTDQLEISQLLKLIELVANLPEFTTLISEYAQHPSLKVQQLVADIQAGKYRHAALSPFELLDWGIYHIPEDDDPSELIKQTTLVRAEDQRCFGLRIGYFPEDDDEDGYEPEVALTVRIDHPYRASIGGYSHEYESSIQLNHSNCLTWNLGEKSSNSTGVYRYRIYHPNGDLLADKVFHVVDDSPRQMALLEEAQQKAPFESSHIGSICLNQGLLDFVDAKTKPYGMIFGCKLPEKPMPVHCHTKDNQLEIAEIHVTPAEPTQWFYASNPTYAFMEQRVKSRVLLVGSTNTITETQSKKSLWKNAVKQSSPVVLIQPDETKANNVAAIYLDKCGAKVFYGFDEKDNLCRIAVTNVKYGLARRFFIRVMNRIAKKIMKDGGEFMPH